MFFANITRPLYEAIHPILLKFIGIDYITEHLNFRVATYRLPIFPETLLSEKIPLSPALPFSVITPTAPLSMDLSNKPNHSSIAASHISR